MAPKCQNPSLHVGDASGLSGGHSGRRAGRKGRSLHICVESRKAIRMGEGT